MRLVFAAMEMAGLVKVGGLADVVDGLSRALGNAGHDVVVVLPGYLQMLESGSWSPLPHAEWTITQGGRSRHQRLWHYTGGKPEVRVLAVEDPGFLRRGIYLDPESGLPFADSAEREAAFCRGVLAALDRMDFVPDVLHAHDYQAALLPFWLAQDRKPGDRLESTATVLTLHNLGYQGDYPASAIEAAELGREHFYPGGPLEFWGRVNLLKVGVVSADLVTTVSPRYAREIKSGGEFGWGLEGVLATRKDGIRGILNGIDTELWNPETDSRLPRTYSANTLEAKQENKAALLERTGLGGGLGRPVFGIISRLVEQKGVELLEAAAEELLARDLSVVVLGSGQAEYEGFFREWADAHPDRVFYTKAFDDPLGHLIQGGADAILVPSQFEPCGLTQLVAQRYGTVPVVRRTGGLADTVTDAGEPGGTGFLFDDFERDALLGAVDRALEAYRNPGIWASLARRGMARDDSWTRVAEGYEAVYAEAQESRARAL